MQDVTVLIPTNSRPHSLENGLRAVAETMGASVPAIVLNSTPSDTTQEVKDAYAAVYAAFPEVQVITYDTAIGPAEARHVLAQACTTDLMLFMDDDHEIRPGSYDVLRAAMDAHDLDIVSGRWVEEGGERALGFRYAPGARDGQKAMFKLPFRYAPDFDGTVLECDDVLATMLCRKSIFEKVSFDPAYDFYFELFDFFMSCRKEGVRIGVAADAVFDHKPTPYMGTSKRQTQRREDDEARFVAKWGVQPVPTPIRPGTAATAPSSAQRLVKLAGRVRRRLAR